MCRLRPRTTQEKNVTDRFVFGLIVCDSSSSEHAFVLKRNEIFDAHLEHLES